MPLAKTKNRRGLVSSASCGPNICGSRPPSVKAHSKIHFLSDRKGLKDIKIDLRNMSKNMSWIRSASNEEEFFLQTLYHSTISGKTRGNDGFSVRHCAAKTVRSASVNDIEHCHPSFYISFEKQELGQHIALFKIMVLGGETFS